MSAPGANLRLGAPHVRAAGELVASAAVVLLQLEPPLETIAEAIRLARAARVPAVLDAAPAQPLPDELIRHLHLLRANAAEAEAVTGIRVSDRRTATLAADQLLDRGVTAAAIEAGDEGDLLKWSRDHDGSPGEAWLPRLPVRSVDTRGAGDAFAAAVAVLLAEGLSFQRVGPFASAAAALAATRTGAADAMPRRSDVLALLSGESPRLP